MQQDPVEHSICILHAPTFGIDVNKPTGNKHVIITTSFNHLFMSTSVACAVGPCVTTSSSDFSFQNLVFYNLFEFSVAEIT